ncbi:WD40/YVTN/BNR-like repeat-containing protein [Mucilaginibacter sp.]
MRRLIICLLLIAGTAQVYAQRIELLQQGRNCSLRGLSVVNNQVAWVSGSRGTVALTTDGAKTWNWLQVKGFEQSDFRDVEAFSAKEAIIMSSGTPAVMMKTTNGGINWQAVYRNEDKAYFLDAMDFTPDGKHGFVLGDPIDNKFLLLETLDGGDTWAKFKYLPNALPGEAAFAASGTCLRLNKDHTISIVTGGSTARLLNLYRSATVWQAFNIPIAQGKPSQGAFSLSSNIAVVVGGDYAHDNHRDSVYFNFSKTQIIPAKSNNAGPAGYQSCVEWLKQKTYLSTGTPGSNLTTDGGQTWKQIDNTSFNVCRKAKTGNLVLLAGDHGNIAVLKI